MKTTKTPKINNELKSIVDYMEREKGLDRKILLETITSSLHLAARKSVSEISNPAIRIDPESFIVTVYGEFHVIEDSKNAKTNEINLKEALEIDPNAVVGGTILIEATPDNFGRIAAQTAKQVIIQKLRDAEANVLYNDYKDKVSQVISGIVRHYDKKNVILDVGRGEAVLPPREQVETEEYHVGDRLKIYVLEVNKSGTHSEIVVSRSHPGFVKKLFEIEVPEIADKTVEIKGIAREAGFRTKIAVYSKDPKVDCVGACVGMRGARVKNIVHELNGEKIDIVPWSMDIGIYCRNALNPAKLKHLEIDEPGKRILIYVDQNQFSLAIGKHGHNARLTSKLLGWKVDVLVAENEMQTVSSTPSSTSHRRDMKTEVPQELDERLKISIEEIEGLSKKVKESLVDAGYHYLGELKSLKIEELYAIPGVGKSNAGEIMDHIQSAMKKVVG
ncbi:MAG: transcription termination/antitermination protein NusA [Candidatus Aureabacteria bacterium]|nr:transcription termination/antitermination protein NusA [Candidatus Auribacterota bacterium]